MAMAMEVVFFLVFVLLAPKNLKNVISQNVVF